VSYLVLARKWRPQRFADLTGQDVIVRTLKNALTSDHLAHAYLMTGIRGVGKTTISRLMAMAVNCMKATDGEPCGACESCTSIASGSNLDVQEMDAASHTGVDDIREILDGVRYPPVHLKTKVYIIDEAHMLSKSAFNALLKTLEEPPENVLFILATTESDKLPITVRSRCQRFDLRRLNVDEIADYLAFVLKEEGIGTQADALQVIARAADGSVRDALSLTERVLAFSNQNITLSDVQQSLGLIGAEQTQQLADAILSGDAHQALQTLRKARELGVSPIHLLKTLSESLHEIMCCKLDSTLVPHGVSPDTQVWLLQHAECWTSQALDMRYQVLIHGLRDIHLVDEQRGAEMVVLRLSHLYTMSPPEKTAQKKTLETSALAKPAPETVRKSVTKAPQSPPNLVTSPIVGEPTPAIVKEPAPIEKTRVENSQQESARKIVKVTLETPNTWEEAMAQYHAIKPGIAAILEHVICESFDQQVCLLLTQHQLDALNTQERSHFETWVKRDVLWLRKSNETGESLLDIKQRKADEYTRKLWQQAEADPGVRMLKEVLGCRLVNLLPPPAATIDNPTESIEPLED